MSVDSLTGQTTWPNEIVAGLAGKGSCSITTVGEGSVRDCTVCADWKNSWWIKPEVICATQGHKVVWAVVMAGNPRGNITWAKPAVIRRVDEVCRIYTRRTYCETCASWADGGASVTHGIGSIEPVSAVACRAIEETWSTFLTGRAVVGAIIAGDASTTTGGVVRSVAIQAGSAGDPSWNVVGLSAVVAVGK